MIEKWALDKGIEILVVTEAKFAHTSKMGGKDTITPDGHTKKVLFRWFFSSGIDPRKHDKI